MSPIFRKKLIATSLIIIFSLLTTHHLVKSWASIKSLVKHKTHRGNVEFSIEQVELYKSHNKNNFPAIYLDGPDPILFYFTHGGYESPAYYGNHLSRHDLKMLLTTSKSFYLVGYNPVFLEYRYHAKGRYLDVDAGKELLLSFSNDNIKGIEFNLMFDESDKVRNQVVSMESLPDNVWIELNGVKLRKSDGQVLIKSNNRSFGFQLCRNQCLDGWLLGEDINVTYRGKTVNLSLKEVLEKYGRFKIINSLGSLYFAKVLLEKE